MRIDDCARLPQMERSKPTCTRTGGAPIRRSWIARLLAFGGLLLAVQTSAMAGEGDLDPAFGVSGVARAGVTNASVASPDPSMLVQPDGKIVLCATTYDTGTMDFNMLVARLNADGTPDPTFSFDGRVSIDFGNGNSDACTSVARQGDGKLVIGGFTADHSGSGYMFAVARLNTDGSLDTDFGNGSGKSTVPFALGGSSSSALARAVAIQADGRIVLAGSASHPDNNADFAIARLLPDGSLDSSFNLTGKVTVAFDLPAQSTSDVAWAVALDAQGRIVAGGTAGNRFAIARLRANGTLDGDFDSDGRATIDFALGTAGSSAYALAVQRDGRIVLAGQTDNSDSGTSNFDMAVARLQADGSLDSSFGFEGKAVIALNLVPNGSDRAVAVIEQSDGRLLFAGFAIGPGNVSIGAVARLKSNGNLDPSFGASGRHTYDIGFQIGGPAFSGLALQGTLPLACGLITLDAGAHDVIVARLQTELLFADGFD